MLTRVHPAPVESLDLDAPTTRPRLLELYRANRTWLRLNLVASISGSAAGSDGTSESLTSRVDRRILGVIREHADVVLVGAASVRAEGYSVPKTARLAILTLSGDLSGHRLPVETQSRVLVLAPTSAVARVRKAVPGAEVLEFAAPTGRASMTDVVSALRGAGFESIVCEGGPGLAGQLVGAGLVDELCLTTSPQLGGVGTALLGPSMLASPLPATLTQLMVDDAGYLYSRWAIAKSPATA